MHACAPYACLVLRQVRRGHLNPLHVCVLDPLFPERMGSVLHLQLGFGSFCTENLRKLKVSYIPLTCVLGSFSSPFT